MKKKTISLFVTLSIMVVATLLIYTSTLSSTDKLLMENVKALADMKPDYADAIVANCKYGNICTFDWQGQTWDNTLYSNK